MAIQASSQQLKDSLARFRDQAADPLVIRLPVDRLLDEHRARMLSSDLALCSGGHGWEIKRATANLHSMLPDSAGLYMFVWRPPVELALADDAKDGRFWFVLYVGQAGADGGAGTLRSRYNSEYRRHMTGQTDGFWSSKQPVGRVERLSRYLNLEELEYWFIVAQRSDLIGSLESRMIRLFNPPLNRQGSSLRPLAPIKAF